MLHALGIHHEQVRGDRDDAVWINGELISKVDADWGWNGNLVYQYRKGKTEQRELPYDFGSVMHYSASLGNEYAEYAIIPRDVAYHQSIVREGGLSFKDAKLINLIYCKCLSYNLVNWDFLRKIIKIINIDED